MKTKSIDILLVEDSPSDKLIATEALKAARVRNNLHIVEDGIEAMDFLHRTGNYPSAPRPDLILLDLNLPRKDGREVLAEIKADESLRLIPVVILTTSRADEDILKSYGQHANCYIAKPVDFNRFAEIVRSVENFWFEIVTLPPGPAPKPANKESPEPIKQTTSESNDEISVLLVEDSDSDALLIEHTLKSNPLLNIAVSRARSLKEGIGFLSGTRVDAVVTDLGLPDSEGLDTFRRLRASANGLPVIVLTGNSDNEAGVLAMREGAQDYLVKNQLEGRTLTRAINYAIERYRLELRLRASQKMESLGRLSGGIAHDFNNLLTVISGNATLLEESVSDPKTCINEIRNAAQRASNLVRQLLTFSRNRSLVTARGDLNEIVSGVHRMLNRVVGDNINLSLQLAARLPAIMVDVSMLEQVVMNLVVNARDAMPNGGRIVIATSVADIGTRRLHRAIDMDPGRYAVLRISDEGTGIPADVLEHIFEPFYTTKEAGKGTGLGLATVYGIIQQHGGYVDIQTESGRGTTFEIFLPTLADSPIEESPKAADAPTAISGGNEVILLVEDESMISDMVTIALTSKGYRLHVAQNGPEAMEKWRLHKNEIRLLITDMVMPEGMSGHDVALAIQEDNPAVKVIYTSGYDSHSQERRVKLVQGVNFLCKPYGWDDLLKIIRLQLDGPPA